MVASCDGGPKEAWRKSMGGDTGPEAGVPEYGRDGWDADLARAIVERHRARPGALLPILHALQEAFGYIDREALALIGEGLNISKAEIHGVVSFYHDFRSAPAGAHVLKICRAEACQSMGAERLVRHVEERHGLKVGQTTADGRLTLQAVYCLGNCALSPAAMLDGALIGRLDEARLDAIAKDRAA
ncbi:MAG: formate dehydrogenase subunit gamma [Pseudomonadota bacterium]|nr:formate dehydrogenase subunit gamma [Pseudomonadota bacterium]